MQTEDKNKILQELKNDNCISKITINNEINTNIIELNNNEQFQEISNIYSKTKRVTCENLDAILGERFDILDHGFIRVIDYMGSDSAIAQAARVSYGAGTKKISEDIALINYLMKHKHTSPFEMCEIKFHIKIPMFVARQWIRHRTANVNEYSARYSIIKEDYYVPDIENIAEQSTTNKQGRNEESKLNDKYAQQVIDKIHDISKNSYLEYQDMLNTNLNGEKIDQEKPSISRELARTILGVNYYTELYWKIDLHNLFHFLHLRADSHAQYEIRVYAEKMLEIVKLWVPFSYNAFMKYRKNAITFSPDMLNTFKKLLKGENINQKDSGLSRREFSEVEKLLNY